MEITLTLLESKRQAAVTYNGQLSHRFDPRPLAAVVMTLKPPPHPVRYGKALYRALFRKDSLVAKGLATKPDRILLVTDDALLEAIPWEYVYGPEGFVVLDYPFVRGLPAEQRTEAPDLGEGLRIIAVPSDPLDESLAPLKIEAEWLRLSEIVQELEQKVILERTRPPTIGQLRKLVANRDNVVVHFMGHGGLEKGKTSLCFEREDGGLALVSAREFVHRLEGKVFLVTLNACVSATPGPTAYSNLTAALVRSGAPYALGMRFTVNDADALSLCRALYSDLARGVSVEQAAQQMRWTLSDSPQPWALGVPVLYTSVIGPASQGYVTAEGTPRIDENQPSLEFSAIPRAERFQGRIGELKRLGGLLTGGVHPRLVTIHGAPGQGKSALAREAVERYAHAWPGGAWAISLETLPSREAFVGGLMRFLKVATEELADPADVERQVIARLQARRTLLVLDNAQTLIEHAEVSDPAALALARFIREQLPRRTVGLLATSRRHLGWTGEETVPLGGLAPHDGAILFRQSAPQRGQEIEMAAAESLSERVDGHPLSLRLLGGAFNESSAALNEFVAAYEERLVEAQDRYKELDHRHRTLYAAIDASVLPLDAELRELLGGLWVFHAPFLPEAAAAIFDPDGEYPEGQRSPVYDRLHRLWGRGLLEREMRDLRDGDVLLYRLLPTMRLYAERQLEGARDPAVLLRRFGQAYAGLARWVYAELNSSARLVYIAQRAREDLARGLEQVEGGELRGWYLLHWGRILHRFGDTRAALHLTKEALEMAQGTQQRLKAEALNNMALVYQAMGQPARAMALYEEALPIRRGMDDRAGVAATLNNMATVYDATGQPERAMELYQQALSIRRAVGDRAGVATTLNNMAGVYQATGQPERALELYEEALPIMRAVGNRAGVAAMLNNMALVYQAAGQPARAMALYEEALPIMRAVGDRAGVAITLNNMAEVYRETGQPERALALYEEALPIRWAVDDRAGIATTLNNMALVYQATGHPERALALYEEVLPIRRAVDDRAGVATTLNNMAAVYQATGQPERALALYEEALPITRVVGDRAGVATTLSNMAEAYRATGQPGRALELSEEALPIRRAVGDRAGEVTSLANLAHLLYYNLGRKEAAVERMEEAIALMREVNLPRDAAGRSLDKLQGMLAAMR